MKTVQTVITCLCDACKNVVEADRFEVEATDYAGHHFGLCRPCVDRGYSLFSCPTNVVGLAVVVARDGREPKTGAGLTAPWSPVVPD